MNQALHNEFTQEPTQPVRLSLLSTQQGIFLADHLSSIEDLYTIAHCLELPKTLNLATFKHAIQLGLSEADTVTAQYSCNPAEPFLQLENQVEIPIEEFDFCHLPPEQAQKRLWDWMPTDRQYANSLKNNDSNLYRQVLFVCHDKVYWYQRYHHIMLDGFSIINLTKRIVEIYQQLQKDELKASPFITVKDVIAERQAYEASPKFQEDQTFWKNYCQDLASPVTLSTHHLAAKTTARFIKHQLHFSQGILAQIQALASTAKLALPDMMMALSLHYLHKMTDKAELVMGIPFMRRLGSKAIRALLPTVNVLPVQFLVNPQHSWVSLAQHVQTQLAQIRPHQKYDAEQILRDLNSIDAHERIYGPILNYKAFDQDLVIDDQAVKTHHISTGPIDDFEFSFIVQNQELIIELRADAARYTQDELLMHSQRLTLLLEQCLAQPEQTCAPFSITTTPEQQLLTKAGTGPRVAHPENYNNVLDIFYEHASKYPDRIAILSGERDSLYQLTFAELKAQINQFTRFLQAHGAKKNTVIAGAIPRSAESVVMMLSVLNSGASFLPLDLDYPVDRMQMMCEDANPLFVLTTNTLAKQLPATLQQIHLDDATVRAQIRAQDATDIAAEQRRFDFQDVAYVIFTSGSTGRPKGVMNTHGSLLNLILAHQHTIYFPVLEAVQQRFPDRPLRAAHTHSFSFDSSWLQVFWLIWGQELHIFDENMRRDAYGLVQEIQQRQIDTLDLPPSFCAQMISNGLFEEGQHHPSLILIGGEAAPLALWQQLNAQPDLFAHNLYGPTEYTVDTFRAELKLTERPVIANPIGNTQAYVLDQNLQRCPIGVIGELYISGFGIANGYLGRADLSSTRFIANPFEHGQRMYRTGDLVRWNMAGKLEFMGRCDDQIKIRGYRVEIGEVENALSVLPNIESVVVIAEPINNSHRLLGYCVVKEIQLDEAKSEKLSQHYLSLLRQNLPDYMVPSALTVMQEFPRNVSGKVDKKALPRPQIRTQSRTAQTPEQHLLCQIAATVLKLEQIGIDDDFFMTGGDSISAIMLCTQLRQHGYGLKPSDVFQLKTIASLVTQLEVLDPKDIDYTMQSVFDDQIIQKVQAEYGQDSIVLPLLPLHKGMLFHAQLEQQQASYNAFTRLSLAGEIDLIQLQQALTNVLRKHPQLAGCFDNTLHNEPIFVYKPNSTGIWPVDVYSSTPESLEKCIADVLKQPMQLHHTYGLIRAVLIQMSSQQSELILMLHHLLTDGWSTPLFMQDFIQAYQQPEQSLTVAKHAYADVILQLVQQDHTRSRQIWKQDLADAQALVLFEHANQQNVQESQHRLNAQLSAALQHKLRQTGITLNVFMQMIWAMCLQSYAHREDILFGTPVAGRSTPVNGIEQQIGLFLNTIPVRVQLQMQQNLWQQLQNLQQLHIHHLEHDGLGLNEIQQQLGQGTLFDSLLVVENYPDHQYLQQHLGSARIEKLTNRGYSHYPLALLVIPDQEIELLLEQRGVIPQPELFLQRIEQLIQTALEQPETSLQHYPLQLPVEQQLIEQINHTAHDVPHTTLQQLLRTQALRHLDAIALVDEEDQLSFAQVRLQVCTLAKRLQQSGVQVGDIVAIALPRSVKLSIAILAIIEAGAAYLPIDIQHPTERIKYMLQDAKPRLTITVAELLTDIDTPKLNFEALFDVADTALNNYKITLVSPQQPAYIIYTSGTTGQPKGVMVSHQAIVNRILWMQHQYPLNINDSILQKTPCSFDVSVWEFFWSYLIGARLVMAPVDAHRDPMVLLDIIQQNNITTLHFVPSMLSVFDEAVTACLTEEQRTALPLKRVFCSGEALPTAMAQVFNQHFNAELHNLYGPTEAAVDVSYMDAQSAQFTCANSIAIGYPVWNTQLYILDQYLRPLPIGAEGELYLAGDQLALGYLQRADLTAARFVANPFQVGQRMYRTGDIARWNIDGSIQYVGRADDQLKIRGQRVELGEIEQQLRQVSQIDEVVVQAMSVSEDKNATDLQLIAYLKTTQRLEASGLKKRLAKHLPAYMIPSHFIALETFPLSHNGKLDRKALPRPQQDITSQQRFASSETELKLEQIFQNILGLTRRIHVAEDFFALGGHSILAMKLAIEIKQAFERSLAVNQIMTGANIEKLAEQVQLQNLMDQANDEAGFDTTFIIRQAKTKPVFCIYPGSGLAWQYSILNRYLHPDISLIGLQSPRPNGALVYSQTMDELIEHQLKQVLDIQSEGPFTFLGYSLGGTIAYGLADRLQRLGHEVAFVGLLDTYPAEIHEWDMQNAAVVTEEAEQEQIQFFNQVLDGADDVLNEEKDSLQEYIFANYRDAVRLLSQHKTTAYAGKIHVFVAEQSLPTYIQPQKNWQPLVAELEIISLADASHENLLSPEQLTTLGPLLNDYLSQVYQLKDSMYEA
jgi:amino acid adenylation domain-containing protein